MALISSSTKVYSNSPPMVLSCNPFRSCIASWRHPGTMEAISFPGQNSSSCTSLRVMTIGWLRWERCTTWNSGVKPFTRNDSVPLYESLSSSVGACPFWLNNFLAVSFISTSFSLWGNLSAETGISYTSKKLLYSFTWRTSCHSPPGIRIFILLNWSSGNSYGLSP